MLRLPGRGKESVSSPGFFSHYKNIFSMLKHRKEDTGMKRDIESLSFGKKADGTIELKDVEKRFGKHVVLHGLNFEIPQGKIFGVIGISGSGKTTLLRLIVGFYKPSKGNVLLNLPNSQKSPYLFSQYFGFATQDNSFYGDLTAEENVRFFGMLYGLSGDYLSSRVDDVLSVVELSDYGNFVARNLSGGMKRRLDLACALVHDPSILILDEPTEDLDPILRRGLLRLIKKINSLGTTIIFTTHVLSEAEYLCDTIAILSHQTVFTIGTSEDLKRIYKGGEEIHITLEDSSRYALYLKRLRKFKPKLIGGRLVIYVPRRGYAVKLLRKILSLVEKDGDRIIYADIRRPSLSEVFTHIIEHAQNTEKKKRV